MNWKLNLNRDWNCDSFEGINLAGACVIRKLEYKITTFHLSLQVIQYACYCVETAWLI